jgi:chemotaxis protein MotA
MGKGTIVGIVCGLGGIFVSMILEGGDPSSLLAAPALILIVIGSFGAACAGMKLEHALDAVKSIGAAFGNPAHDPVELIDRMSTYAETARREGVLALEKSIPAEQDEFLRSALQLVVDGTGVEESRHGMIAEIQAGKRVWKRRAGFYNKLGGYAPTFGIIGTVLGLIHTLESLGGDPAELGHLIAAAFIATLFGVLFANAIYLPIGAKLQAIGDQEAEARLLVLEGVKWIAEGRSPRQIREMLPRFLDPAERRTNLQLSA